MRPIATLFIFVAVLAVILSSLHSMPVKLAYNGSASAPIGFYWVDQAPAKAGDFVLTRLPDKVRKLAEARGYLPPRTPLIKRIAAAEGDAVCRLDGKIYINGNTVGKARMSDARGHPLPDWQGCYLLKANQIFLLQTHLDSFDSRYFGVLDRSHVIGRARHLEIPAWK